MYFLHDNLKVETFSQILIRGMPRMRIWEKVSTFKLS